MMYNQKMRSHPYLGISEPVAGVAKELIESADPYHRVHAARLARTAEIIYHEIGQVQRVLELGTSGFVPLLFNRLLPDTEVHVTHFDPTNKTIQDINIALGENTITAKAFNIDLEKDNIPMSNERYDAVICCEVLEHMEIDPMFMLAEVNRVIKPNGKLLLTTPNITSSRALHKILNGYEPHFYMQYHKSREYHRHNYEYSAPALVSVLQAAGFSGKVWSEDLFDDPVTSIVDKLRLCGFPVEQPGDNLIALAVKISDVVDRHPSQIYV